PERLKELQKTFRQHARDERRELLPAVQQALSEEQVQTVVEKIEAGVAEAEKARQDEIEARRLKARQEREEAERQAEQQAEAERAAVNAQPVGREIQDAANIYLDAVKTMVPDLQTVATLPETAVGAMEEIRSAWIEWMGQTTLTGTRISQDLLRQAAEQQRRF